MAEFRVAVAGSAIVDTETEEEARASMRHEWEEVHLEIDHVMEEV